MTRRALVVDDESLARLRLRKLLAAHGDVEVVAEATCVAEARQVLERGSIDVVFLDIQMPGGSGFALCDGAQPLPPVIFVTAYEQHAIRAFEVNALDYLLKPVHPERLARCLERLSCPRDPAPALGPEDPICIAVGRGLQMLPLADIRYIRAEGDYTEIYTKESRTVLCSISMREWERRLPPERFVRIHRSSIVALAAIDRIEGSGRSGYTAWLRGGDERLEISRRQARSLRERLEGMARDTGTTPRS